MDRVVAPDGVDPWDYDALSALAMKLSMQPLRQTHEHQVLRREKTQTQLLLNRLISRFLLEEQKLSTTETGATLIRFAPGSMPNSFC